MTVSAPDVERPAPRDPRVPPGLLLVDKPVGVTSHDVVEKVRRRLHARGAGHLGTLDPGASGLLLVAIGAATRCASVWQGGDKTYEATARLGVTTVSQDLSGEVIERREVRVSEAEVRAAAAALTGEFEQIPPMVSALKHGGERLYAIARRGESVERAPRRVRVDAWEWLGFELPDVRFRVRCSGGTYVRTLAHDLGRSLGCGAALASLRRIRSEPFGVERAVPVRDLDRLPAEEVWRAGGIPLDEALGVLPSVTLDAAETTAIGYGAPVAIEPGRVAPDAVGRGPRSLALRDASGCALALGEALSDPAGDLVRVRPQVVFPWAVREGRP